MASADHFARPLNFSFAAKKANMSCNVFSHSTGSLFHWSTLALQFISAPATNQTEIEWLLLRTDALQELLLRRDKESCTQGIIDVDNSYMDGVHSSPGQHHSHFWTLAPHARIDTIASAVCFDIAEPFCRDEIEQFISFASAICTRSGVISSVTVNIGNNKHTQTLFVAVTKSFEFVCYVDKVFLYTKQLPFTSSTIADSMMLQITNHASNPLLVFCVEHSVLVIDLLHNGNVLKEFSNIGGCMCASLFHPLSQQLFIIPSKEVERVDIHSIPGGFVHRDNSTSSIGTSTHLDSVLVLSDWFVYELPDASADGNTALAKCRSIDPTGRWREGTVH